MTRLPLLVAIVSTVALGHGGAARSLSVNLRPGSDAELWVSTSFGPVVSYDQGRTWKVICEEAIGYGTGLIPVWLLTPTHATFAGSFKGLFVSRGDGCVWESLPDFETTGCSDLQAQGTTLLATSGRYGVENRILRSTDDGRSWTPTPERSSTLFYTSVRISPSNPNRVYAGAWWFKPYATVLLRSDDNGQTYTRLDLSSTLPLAGAFYVLAVHPQKPEVLFATLARDAQAWLLRSTDSGQTFTPVITSTEVFGSVAFGAEPGVVYAASGSALYRSSDEGQSFTALARPANSTCVTTRGGSVYACGLQELDGFAVGQGDGGPFSALLDWNKIAGPISCPADSAVQTLCVPLWPVVKATFPSAVAPAPDAGPSVPPATKGCGCASVEAPLWLAIILFIRRPRSG